MIKLDENLLVELGLATLPKEEKTSFLKHMYETLEMRVGTRLAERMSDQQMSEFEQFINSNDEQGAFHWLEGNFPNYKEVVAEEFEKLKGEIGPMAADILAASQAQAQSQLQDGAAQSMQPAGATQGPSQQDPSVSGYPQQQPAQQQPQQPAQPPQTFQQPAPQAPPQQYSAPPQQQPHQSDPQQPQQPGHHPQYPQQ
jgi:hypothetical protein